MCCSYSAVQSSTVQYNTAQYSTVQYTTVQHSTVQYTTVQYSTVHYGAVQYSTVHYVAVQYLYDNSHMAVPGRGRYSDRDERGPGGGGEVERVCLVEMSVA